MKKWKWFGGAVFLIFFLVLWVVPMEAEARNEENDYMVTWGISQEPASGDFSNKDLPERVEICIAGYPYYYNIAVGYKTKIQTATLYIYKGDETVHYNTYPISDYVQYVPWPITIDEPGQYEYMWYVSGIYEKDGTNKTWSYARTGNFTVQAITVSFNANGGSISTSSKSVAYNNSYGTLPTPSRTGYTFTGWYTSSSGGNKITSSSTVTTTSNQTLYAHWKAGTYKVTFNANKGKCSTASKSVTYKKNYGTLPTPTRNGYKFLGWYTSSGSGSKVTAATTVKITKNQTLYAHWKVKKPDATTVTAKIVSANAVKVSWKKVSGAKGYIVYRATSKNGSYKKCADVKGALSYTDKKLKAGNSYYYKIVAYKVIDGKTVYGSKSKAAGKRVIGALATPNLKLKLNKEKKTFTLSWNTIKNAQKIEIYERIDDKAWKKKAVLSTSKGRKVSYSYADFPKGHEYRYIIRAYYQVDGTKIYSKYSTKAPGFK